LKGYIQKNHQQLNTIKVRVKLYLRHALQEDKKHLGIMQKSFILLAKNLLKDEKKRLVRLEATYQLLDPSHVMKRGYTLTFRNGVLIKSSKLLNVGDTIETEWSDGNVSSTVKEKN
jgi:exodeoxyribonuclease VII large subunit